MQHKSTFPIFRKSASKTLKVLLAIILTFAVSYGAFGYYASFLLKREYNKIRQQGEPLFFSEVAANKVPDSENAALLYIKAAEELKLPKGYHFQKGASQHLKQLTMQDNQKVLRLVEHASRLTQSHFPVQWKGSPDNWINIKIGKMSNLARLIRLNALENARKQDYTKAFQEIGYIDQLAARAANGDTLMNFLVARSLNALGVRTTYTILQDAQLTKQQAQACLQLLPRADWHQLFYNNMLGERAFGVSTYAYYLSDMWNRKATEADKRDIYDDDESSCFKQKGFLTRPLLKLDEVQSLRLWTKVLLQAQKPGAVDTDYENKIQSRLNQLPFYADGAKGSHEVFARSFRNRDQAEVDQREQEIALALNAYRTEHGQYPETLTEAQQFWDKRFPLDPYTNNPFHYRILGDNYILYSVGQNCIDDGGTKQPKDKRSFDKITDLIWGDYPS
jgi:hypothetical protein